MAIFTLTEVEEQISLYKQAIKALATAQEYRNGDMSVRRADLPALRSHLEWLERERQKIVNNRPGPISLAGRPAR